MRLWESLQLLQRVVLDLADSLAGDAEGAADFLERQRLGHREAVAQFDHLALALGQGVEGFADALFLQVLAGFLERLQHGVVVDEIAELETNVREVRDVLRMAQQPVSLEKPIGEEEESELGDFVEDETAESPFELALENLRRENVRKALAALPRRDREVLELRYGLNGRQPMTLEEVGDAFGVTRERVRQVESRALRELRTRAPELQLYLRTE